MTITFSHDPRIRQAFPTLAAGVLLVDDVHTLQRPDSAIEDLEAAAARRLSERSEGEFTEIQAWRRAFAQMGLKPTQYRSASEALLRRFRKEGALPRLHPLVDLCNAASIASAIPVAVFDRDTITSDLVVRHAQGDEDYLTFAGEHETPVADEVIFADATGHAHARRWTNRQSARSATRPHTRVVLVVAEALHDNGQTAVATVLDSIRTAISRTGRPSPEKHMLSHEQPSVRW